MYVNFEFIKDKVTPVELIVLQMCKQQKNEDLSDSLEPFENLIPSLIRRELLTEIKGTKKQSPLSKLRISDKGKKLLEKAQIPLILDEDVRIFEWLEDVYKSSDKEIGNRKKTQQYIANFRVESGIDRNKLAKLCKTFIDDDSNFEWSKRLEYLFWKPRNVFDTTFDIEQSRLYMYYLQNKTIFDKQFSKM
jgi:hypothetical protein